jgi:hypothetical protein
MRKVSRGGTAYFQLAFRNRSKPRSTIVPDELSSPNRRKPDWVRAEVLRLKVALSRHRQVR